MATRTIGGTLALLALTVAALGGCTSVLGLDAGEYDQTIDNPCDLCASKKCAGQRAACTEEIACVNANQCLRDRNCSEPSCFDACEAENASVRLRPYYFCVATACSAECSGK